MAPSGLALAVVPGLGSLVLAAAFAGLVAALAVDPDPFRLRQAPLWAVAIVFGVLCLRVMLVVFRMLRARGPWRIDDEGVTNGKDGIGPIAWADIRDASIRELPSVPRAGSRSGLFVEIPEAVAGRQIAAGSLLARRARYPSAPGDEPLPGVLPGKQREPAPAARLKR